MFLDRDLLGTPVYFCLLSKSLELWCFTPPWRAYGHNLRTKTLDFRGFDSSIVLILRGGIIMSIGRFPESLSQAILAGIISVGRLGAAALDCAIDGSDIRCARGARSRDSIATARTATSVSPECFAAAFHALLRAFLHRVV